jgi:hypothetical protein
MAGRRGYYHDGLVDAVRAFETVVPPDVFRVVAAVDDPEAKRAFVEFEFHGERWQLSPREMQLFPMLVQLGREVEVHMRAARARDEAERRAVERYARPREVS